VQFGFNQAELIEHPTKILVCSGQTSIGADGAVQHPNDMAAQVQDALENLAAVLAEAGMTMADVVRTTTYVTDMDAYLRAMRNMPTSASTLIGVSRLAYPDLMVEIEAIAIRSGS
jgi:enamine deaminase RidA (YjgF/YER057c/UK114 family)